MSAVCKRAEMLVRSSALHNAHPTPGWIRVGGSGCCGAGLCERCGDTAGTAPGSCTALGPSQPPPAPPRALFALRECGDTAGTALSVWGRVVTVPSMATGARKWGRDGVPRGAERLAVGAAGPRVLLGVTAAVGRPLFKDPKHVYPSSCGAARSGFGFAVWVWSGAGR